MTNKSIKKTKGKSKTELELKKPDGTVIWKREEELKNKLHEENNAEAENLKSQFDSLIKQCHQILYNNGAIVGKNAMNDIMKVLTLKLLQPLFQKGQFLRDRCDEYINDPAQKHQKDELEEICKMCADFNFADSKDLADTWKQLVNELLFKIIGNIYDSHDTKFNASDKAIKLIFAKIDTCSVFKKLTKEKKGVTYYDSISGQIYEYFINKYVKGGGKDLGQIFTPRYMIDLMIYGLNIEGHIDIDKNTSIYDPCAGSGGFLTRLYNCFSTKIKPSNIYGGEIEKDTIKFCISNLLLTTSTFCDNIVHDNSVIYEDDMKNHKKYADNKHEKKDTNNKYDIILTNPPFGTSMQYCQCTVKEGGKLVKKQGLEDEYNSRYPGNKPNIAFKTIYPIKTNDGASLFTQKCVYKLKDNGLLSIVLPDGQLFFGKNFKKFREWLFNKINIKYIVQVPSGAFEHAGIKTCVIMAVKNGKTKKIQFLKTDKECSYLERIIDVDSDELVLGEYSFDPKDYLEDAYLSKMMDGSCVEWVNLGDVCEIRGGMKEEFTQYIVEKSNFKLIKGHHISDGVCTDNIYVTEDLVNLCKKKRKQAFLKENDILLKIVGDPVAMIIPKYLDGALFMTSLKLTNIDKTIVLKYMVHLFSSKFKETIKQRGSIFKAVTVESLSNFKIPVPTFEIQQKIVTELDQLEEHTKALKQLLEHTKKAKAMYATYGLVKEIRELLAGCEWKALGDVCEFQNGFAFKSTEYRKQGIPLITIKNLYGNKLTYINCDFIRESSKYKNYEIIKNDMILSLTGDVGQCSIHIDDVKCYLNQRLCKIIPLNINKMYAYYIFIFVISRGIKDKYSKGSVQANISTQTIASISIPVPALEIQEKCINVYQKKEAMLKEYDEELEKIENNIKHNQELGKQVIEYYITADAQPADNDTADSENENGDKSNEYSDDEHTVEQNKKVKHKVKQNKKVKHSKDSDGESTEHKSKKVVKKVKVTKKESSDDDSRDESTGQKSKKVVKKVKIIKKNIKQ